MWDFLKSIPWPYSVSLLVIVLIVCLILILRGNISIQNKDLVIGKRKVPHQNCPYNSDFKRLMMKTIETMAKYFEIKNVKTLELQMAMLEEQMTFIFSIFMSAYSKALVGHIKTRDLHECNDYRNYNNLLTILTEQSMKPMFRQTLKQNNLLDKSDSEYREYIISKIEVIYKLGEIFMDGHYHLDIVSRDELKEINMSTKDKVTSKIFDIFYKARDISKENTEQAQTLIDELHTYCDDLCGIKRL